MPVIVVIGLALLVLAAASATPPNILYLMADDLRPELGCYGHPFIKTPNIDALAARGLLFDFAYTQISICAPSRNSFLSGRRPDRTRVLNFLTTFRQAPGGTNWTAMPQFFKNKGYFTSSAGKIYHDGEDDAPSWSFPSNQTAWIQCSKGDEEDEYGNYCGVTAKSEFQYTDEDLALEEGLKRMDLAQASGKPWWVSIGAHRPHWKYRTPQGFYGPDLYPGDIVQPPKHPGAPEGEPWMAGAYRDSDVQDPKLGCPTCIAPSNRTVEYRRWYYAAVTWTDHCLGRALDKLKAMGAEDSTIVVFHSDHGYQLGELNEWAKKTNKELATHVPLIISVPWKPSSIGQRTTVLTELIDIYPTLAELSGLGPVEDGVQGTSLATLFDNPLVPQPALRSKVAFSEYPKCACKFYADHNVTECNAAGCMNTPMSQFNFIGYSIRTDVWRYTAWVAFDNSTMRVDWDKTEGRELYNLQGDDGRNFDFDGYSVNLAGEATYADLVSQLHETLKTAVNSWY